jgi:uncharacterized protein
MSWGDVLAYRLHGRRKRATLSRRAPQAARPALSLPAGTPSATRGSGRFLQLRLGYLSPPPQRAAQDGEDDLRFAAAALVAVLAFHAPSLSRADPLLTYPLKIKGHVIRVELANTEGTRRTGLMFRQALPENEGMLFVYEVEGKHAMWMKNTLIPLSVAFIDRSGRIINIEDMQPQTEDAHGAQASAAFSLETNQGWFKKRGIRAGDRVQGLERVPPSRE